MIIIQILEALFAVYRVMIFIRIISSWFSEWRSYPIIQFIIFYTDPFLNIFRGVIPPLGMLDLSPIIALFALSFLESMTKWIIVSLIS